MAYDVYDPCPCGSEKKLKFCCHAVADDMDRIGKLIANGQQRMALQALETLEQAHPGTSWVLVNLANLYLEQFDYKAAHEAAAKLIQAHPSHKAGLFQYAVTGLPALGYEGAKPAIHKVLEHAHKDDRSERPVSLMLTVSNFLEGTRSIMAARQYLVLAMRLSAYLGEKEQEDVFMRLLAFDSNTDYPYPLRSVHELSEISTERADFKNVCLKGWQQYLLGFWSEAAKLFTQAAAMEPENADVWKNVGLCRAWDGDELGAAEALHEAARLESDFDAAVEYETIAQLLDMHVTDDRVNFTGTHFLLKSFSRTKALLEQHGRFVREMSDPEKQAGRSPEAGFKVLDRPIPDIPPQDWTADTVPVALGDIGLYEADQNRGSDAVNQAAQAVLFATAGPNRDDALELFRKVAGDEFEQPPGGQGSVKSTMVLESKPREEHLLDWRWYFPTGVPFVVRHRLYHEKWRHLTNDIWPATNLAALDGKTPLEAAQDPDLKLQRTAALYVLDAQTACRSYVLDLNPLRERLNIDEPRPVSVNPQTPFHSFSAMKLHRLPLDRLSDSQLIYVMNRALLIRYAKFLYNVLTEALSRPACHKHMELGRVYRALVQICRERFQREEALSWVEKGLEDARSKENAFEEIMRWELLALMIRLEDPQDPALQPLIEHVFSRYATKVPQLGEQLMALLHHYGATPPEPTSGLWTPPESGERPEPHKKLWLPGQSQ